MEDGADRGSISFGDDEHPKRIGRAASDENILMNLGTMMMIGVELLQSPDFLKSNRLDASSWWKPLRTR